MGTLRTFTAIFLLLSTLAWAEELPSVHQIYQTVQAGQLNKAHSMIDQVLKAHPNSAKAHFVDAEILARQGDMAAAKAELATAEKLDPALSFAKPKTVAELKAHLNGGNYSEKTGSSDHQVGSDSDEEKPFPWMMLLVVVGAVAIIVMILKSRSGSTPAGGYSPAQRNNPNGVSPYNNGMGNNGYYPQQQPTSGGLGSTIMGGLAGGVAAGAGIVAGEALMHHFIDDDKPTESSHSGNTSSSYVPEPETDSWSDDSDFGISDGDSWGDSGGDSGGDSW